MTRSLWMAVSECGYLLDVMLSHGVMIASLYGNPSTSVEDANAHIWKMYERALGALPYIKIRTEEADSGDMVDEWYRINGKTQEQKNGSV